MASNATAKRGGSRNAKKAGKGAPAKKKTAKKKTAPRKRAKNGEGQKPATQAALLATVRRNHGEGITADEYAERYQIPADDVYRFQAFALEYLKDFNLRAAALRMGYPESSADSTAQLLFNNAYTQLFLFHTIREAKAEQVVTQGQIMAKAWEEANKPDIFGCSNSTSRIAALNLCAKILGMGAPKPPPPPKVAGVSATGIMFVPLGATQEEWESHAKDSQRKLKEAVCVDAEIVK